MHDVLGQGSVCVTGAGARGPRRRRPSRPTWLKSARATRTEDSPDSGGGGFRARARTAIRHRRRRGRCGGNRPW
eukprot:365424-Chlamydomonas_euryale.AAC.17